MSISGTNSLKQVIKDFDTVSPKEFEEIFKKAEVLSDSYQKSMELFDLNLKRLSR